MGITLPLIKLTPKNDRKSVFQFIKTETIPTYFPTDKKSYEKTKSRLKKETVIGITLGSLGTKFGGLTTPQKITTAVKGLILGTTGLGIYKSSPTVRNIVKTAAAKTLEGDPYELGKTTGTGIEKFLQSKNTLKDLAKRNEEKFKIGAAAGLGALMGAGITKIINKYYNKDSGIPSVNIPPPQIITQNIPTNPIASSGSFEQIPGEVKEIPKEPEKMTVAPPEKPINIKLSQSVAVNVKQSKSKKYLNILALEKPRWYQR